MSVNPPEEGSPTGLSTSRQPHQSAWEPAASVSSTSFGSRTRWCGEQAVMFFLVICSIAYQICNPHAHGASTLYTICLLVIGSVGSGYKHIWYMASAEEIQRTSWQSKRHRGFISGAFLKQSQKYTSLLAIPGRGSKMPMSFLREGPQRKATRATGL